MVWFMVFNATFNNISVISWQSVLLVEENRVPGNYIGQCRFNLSFIILRKLFFHVVLCQLCLAMPAIFWILDQQTLYKGTFTDDSSKVSISNKSVVFEEKIFRYLANKKPILPLVAILDVISE